MHNNRLSLSRLTAGTLTLGLFFSLQVVAGSTAHAATSITIDSQDSCEQFLSAVGASGHGQFPLVCFLAGGNRIGFPPTIPAGMTVTVADTWTLAMDNADPPFGFVVAGKLVVRGHYGQNAWGQMLVTGELDIVGTAELPDDGADTPGRLENRGTIVNSGIAHLGTLVNIGTLVNEAAATLEIDPSAEPLINSGALTNAGDLAATELHNFGTLTNAGTLLTREWLLNGLGSTTTNTGVITIEGALTNKGMVDNKGRILIRCPGTVVGAVTGEAPELLCSRATAPATDAGEGRTHSVVIRWEKIAGAVDVGYRMVVVSPTGERTVTDYAVLLNHTTDQQLTFTGTPGETYEFSVRVYDSQGNPDNWSPPASTTFATDDRDAGTFGPGWKSKLSTKTFQGTYRVATGSGKKWTVTDDTNAVRIYGTTHHRGGKARIYIDGKYRRTISTYSRHTHYRRALYSATLDWGRHTITLISKKSGRHNKLIIDAFAALR